MLYCITFQNKTILKHANEVICYKCWVQLQIRFCNFHNVFFVHWSMINVIPGPYVDGCPLESWTFTCPLLASAVLLKQSLEIWIYLVWLWDILLKLHKQRQICELRFLHSMFECMKDTQCVDTDSMSWQCRNRRRLGGPAAPPRSPVPLHLTLVSCLLF